jgi:antitoxin component YwqK of YwqJK toxin-antitoxin module
MRRLAAAELIRQKADLRQQPLPPRPACGNDAVLHRPIGETSMTELADEIAEQRDADGRLVSRCAMRGGVPHGPTVLFGPDGLATAEIAFAAGQRDRPIVVDDANGNEQAQLTWRDGVLDGLAVFSSAGRVVTEMHDVVGVAEGPMRSFLASGTLACTAMLRQSYLNGLPDGEMQELDPAGTARRRSAYRAGRLDGR